MELSETVRNGYYDNAAGRAALKKRKARKAKDDALYHGIAIALATVNRQHDQPTCVCNALSGLGITLSDLEAAGVEAYDLDEIKKCLAQGGPSDRKQVSKS